MGAELPRRRNRGAEPKIKFVLVATSPGDLELCRHFTRVNSEFILNHESTTKIVRPLEIGLLHSRPIGWPAATSRSSPNLGCAHETEKIVRLGLPRIIRPKKTLQNSITARFTRRLVLKTRWFVVEV